jgi:hypothetical protein
MYSSDSTRPIAPTMIRISPTVVIEIPESGRRLQPPGVTGRLAK